MTTLSTPRTDLDALADTYDEQGYVLVKGLLTPEEAAEYRARSHELIASLDRKDDPTWEAAASVAMGQKTSLQHLHDAQFYDAAYTRLLTDPRFTDVAAAVLRHPGRAAAPHEDVHQAAGERLPFPAHQDHPFFPTPTTGWPPRSSTSTTPRGEGACASRRAATARASRALRGGRLPPAGLPMDQLEPMEAEAGDVLFFTYLTVHSSGVNVSDEARTTWLVQFRDPADPPLTTQHDHSLGQGLMLAGSDPTGRAGTA